jgi:hypothetical protein
MKQITLLCLATIVAMSALSALIDYAKGEYFWVVFDLGMAFLPVFFKACEEEEGEEEC